MTLTRQRRSSTVTRRLVMAATVVAAALPLALPTQSASAAIVSNISFKASVHSTYNHSTGGGAFNDGSVTWVKGELQGTDYACGDVASFLFTLVTSADQASSDVEVTLEYTADTTGQSGVALVPLVDADHLRVNTGLIPNRAGNGYTGSASGYDGAFAGAYTGANSPASVAVSPAPAVTAVGAVFTAGAKQRLVFTVQSVPGSSTTVVRSDARILCKTGSRPTGNLQGSLMSARVTSPVTQTISGGNQTVNFRNVGNLAGLTSPMLEVVKEVYDSTTTATCPTEPTGATDLVLTTAPSTVRYCYWVYNWAAATANGVTLTDDVAGTGPPQNITLTFPAGSTAPDLAGGGAVATGTMVQTYEEPGNFTNTVTASATNGTSTTASATFGLHSGPVLVKKVVEGDADLNPSLCDDAVDRLNLFTESPGPVTVSYCYTLSNYGSLDLLNVALTDDEAIPGNVSPATVTLETLTDSTDAVDTDVDADDVRAGDSVTGVLVAELDSTEPATFTNTATATATDTNGTPGTLDDTATVTFRDAVKEVTITKYETSEQPTAVGDVITYELRVENTGDVPITDLEVTDDNATISGCIPSLDGLTLDPGDTVLCGASHTVTQADMDEAGVDNTASVSGTAGGTSVTDTSNTVVTPLAQSPELSVMKVRTSTGPYTLDSEITYDIVAVNTGNVTLSDVVVSDSMADSLTCEPSTPVTLSPEAMIECTATKTVDADDVDATRVVNVATAVGEAPNGNPTTGASNRVVTPVVAPANPCAVDLNKDGTCPAKLTITLRQTSSNPTRVGELVRYRGTITNSGGLTVLRVTPSPNNWVIDSCDPEAPATLEPGESMTCVGHHVTTAADLASGRIDVTLSALGRTADGDAVPTDEPDVQTPIPVVAELPKMGTSSVGPMLWWVAALVFSGAGLLGLTRIRRRRA